jgi:hypothetical protein
MADSIRPTMGTSGFTGPLKTSHGSAANGFKLDLFSQTVLGFMDLRVEGVSGSGVGADQYLCCDATNQYLNRILVGPGGGSPVSYEIQYDPTTGSATDHTIGVMIMYSNGKTGAENIDVVRQPDGTYKIASMCNTCGGL